MTVALGREKNSEPPMRLDADQDGEVRVLASHPGAQFVKLVDADGSIHLIPWEALDEAEKALLSDPQLHQETLAAIKAFQRGEGVSSDWLFDTEE